MKISTFFTTLLVISGVLFIFGMMAQEAGDNYPDSNISTSEWRERYDYVNDINNTISPLQDTFNKIEDENTGWFTKITAGISAIPLAVIRLPALLFKGFVSGGELITGTFTTLGIPSYLILLVLVGFLVWGIFKLMEAYQRWQL